MEEAHRPDATEILNLPKDNLTLKQIRQYLTTDERLWLARMVQAYGERQILAMWPSYEVQINFARSLSDSPLMSISVPVEEPAEPVELTPEDGITI
jgi:hypothetical protein